MGQQLAQHRAIGTDLKVVIVASSPHYPSHTQVHACSDPHMRASHKSSQDERH
jgi:hypothetical protein